MVEGTCENFAVRNFARVPIIFPTKEENDCGWSKGSNRSDKKFSHQRAISSYGCVIHHPPFFWNACRSGWLLFVFPKEMKARMANREWGWMRISDNKFVRDCNLIEQEFRIIPLDRTWFQPKEWGKGTPKDFKSFKNSLDKPSNLQKKNPSPPLKSWEMPN